MNIASWGIAAKPGMKKPLLLGLCGALIVLLLSASLNGLLQSWELKTIDMRFVLQGAVETDAGIILIDADDSSALRYGPWPWDRSVHADLIDRLSGASPSVVAYNVLFPQLREEKGDSRLFESSKKAGNIIYPVMASLSETQRSKPATQPSDPEIASDYPDTSATQNYLSTEKVLFPAVQLIQKDGLGHTAFHRDRDGIIRRVPLLVRHRGKLLPSLAFQAVLNYLQVPGSSVVISGSSILLKEAQFPGTEDRKNISIPVDSKGRMLINYTGKWGESFPHTSVATVLSSGPESQNSGADLSGKLVLVSNTLSGNDLEPTPLQKDYPGSGIHAHIINTILTQNFLRQTHPVFNIALIILLSLATARIFVLPAYKQKIIGVVALAAGVIILGILLFNSGIIVEMVRPVGSIFITTLLLAFRQGYVEKEISDSLRKEKLEIETCVRTVSRNLEVKEQELERTREEEIKREKVQSDQNRELQNSLNVLEEKNSQLQTYCESMEDRVRDLQLHQVQSGAPLEKFFMRLMEECRAFGIITINRQFLETFNTLKQYAQVPSHVIILGESGTGKELFAHALHSMSLRCEENFVPVNMAAIPKDLVESELFGHVKGAFTGAIQNKKGKFPQAHRGTIFLDEIGDTELNIQVKLLRVLQESMVQPVGGDPFYIDARVVSATHKDLKKNVEQGFFREDLFYRLSTLTLTLPPLRDRKDDIPILVQYFVKKYCEEFGKKILGISDQAMKILQANVWRGNIRELENVIQRGITMAAQEIIQEKDLGLDDGHYQITESEPDQKTKEGLNDEDFLAILRENGCEINSTSAKLNMSRNTVASRFKGICFDLLVKHQLDSQKVCDEISGGCGHEDLIMQKIVEYHDNLIKSVKDYEDMEEAVDSVIKRSKNIPSQYRPAIAQLIEDYFSNKR